MAKRTEIKIAVLIQVMDELGFDRETIGKVFRVPQRTVSDIINGKGCWTFTGEFNKVRELYTLYLRRCILEPFGNSVASATYATNATKGGLRSLKSLLSQTKGNIRWLLRHSKESQRRVEREASRGHQIDRPYRRRRSGRSDRQRGPGRPYLIRLAPGLAPGCQRRDTRVLCQRDAFPSDDDTR